MSKSIAGCAGDQALARLLQGRAADHSREVALARRRASEHSFQGSNLALVNRFTV